MRSILSKPTALPLDQQIEGKTGRGLRVSGTLEGYVTQESLWSWLLGYKDYPTEHE